MAFNADYKAPASAGLMTMQQAGKPSTLASAVSQAQGKGAGGDLCSECGQAMPVGNTDDPGDS